MPANPQTPQKYAALVKELGRLVATSKALDKARREIGNGLYAAISEHDPTTIQLETKAFAVETQRLRELQRQCEAAIAQLVEIEEDDDFVAAEHKKLRLLSTELNRLRDNATVDLEGALNVLNDAKKAAVDANRNFIEATRALETLDTLAGKFRDATLARGKVVDLHLAAARKAADGREREAFKKAIGNAQSNAQTLRDDAQSFLKSHAARLADFARQFGKEKLADPLARSAVKAAAAVEAEAMRIELAVDRVADLAPPPIDPYKAAKALGIDKQVAKLKKALDGARDDIADQLQSLSRDLGLGRSGKQLVEDLRKARVL